MFGIFSIFANMEHVRHTRPRMHMLSTTLANTIEKDRYAPCEIRGDSARVCFGAGGTGFCRRETKPAAFPMVGTI